MTARWIDRDVDRHDEPPHTESWLVRDDDMVIAKINHPAQGSQDYFDNYMRSALSYANSEFGTLEAARSWCEENAGLHSPEEQPEAPTPSPMIGVSPTLRKRTILQKLFE